MKRKRTKEILIEIKIIRIPKDSLEQKKPYEKQSVEKLTVWNIFSTNFLKKLSRNLRLS